MDHQKVSCDLPRHMMLFQKLIWIWWCGIPPPCRGTIYRVPFGDGSVLGWLASPPQAPLVSACATPLGEGCAAREVRLGVGSSRLHTGPSMVPLHRDSPARESPDSVLQVHHGARLACQPSRHLAASRPTYGVVGWAIGWVLGCSPLAA